MGTPDRHINISVQVVTAASAVRRSAGSTACPLQSTLVTWHTSSGDFVGVASLRVKLR